MRGSPDIGFAIHGSGTVRGKIDRNRSAMKCTERSIRCFRSGFPFGFAFEFVGNRQRRIDTVCTCNFILALRYIPQWKATGLSHLCVGYECEDGSRSGYLTPDRVLKGADVMESRGM